MQSNFLQSGAYLVFYSVADRLQIKGGNVGVRRREEPAESVVLGSQKNVEEKS